MYLTITFVLQLLMRIIAMTHELFFLDYQTQIWVDH